MGVRITVQTTKEYDVPTPEGKTDQEYKTELRVLSPEDLNTVIDLGGVLVVGSDQTDMRVWVFEA